MVATYDEVLLNPAASGEVSPPDGDWKACTTKIVAMTPTVSARMTKKGAPVVMVLPKEGSGYEMEANGLTRKGAKNPAAKQFLDWAITDEAMALYAKYFAAVGVAGFPVPEGLPKDISKVVYPNDFDWSAKNRDRILTEWQKRYAK